MLGMIPQEELIDYPPLNLSYFVKIKIIWIKWKWKYKNGFKRQEYIDGEKYIEL